MVLMVTRELLITSGGRCLLSKADMTLWVCTFEHVTKNPIFECKKKSFFSHTSLCISVMSTFYILELFVTGFESNENKRMELKRLFLKNKKSNFR